jgi:integrase
MSVRLHRGGWEVRWRDADGRQRARRFQSEDAARAFDDESAGVGQPLDRTTVSRDWHKQALEDAALRDMPLHALRHTAAAAWLAAGNSLMYVQRQLGHADISTTERYHSHLERHVLAAGAMATEAAIARASRPTALQQ